MEKLVVQGISISPLIEENAENFNSNNILSSLIEAITQSASTAFKTQSSKRTTHRPNPPLWDEM